MTRFVSGPPTLFIFLAAILTSGCGSSRQLQSVNLSPPTADAKSFPGGQVTFAATGNFNKPPSPTPLTSNDVFWCAGLTAGSCAGNINPGATVDQNGVAQCLSAFVGTTYIMAVCAGAAHDPHAGVPAPEFVVARGTLPPR